MGLNLVTHFFNSEWLKGARARTSSRTFDFQLLDFVQGEFSDRCFQIDEMLIRLIAILWWKLFACRRSWAADDFIADDGFIGWFGASRGCGPHPPFQTLVRPSIQSHPPGNRWPPPSLFMNLSKYRK